MEEKKHYSLLLALETNSYLSKIYSVLGKKVRPHLLPLKLSAEALILKNVSLGASKMWEFKLNSREKVRAGDVGKIIVATRGIKNSTLRKQRALFIAAESYVYHAFANNKDPSLFSSISSQNQYLDAVKKLFGREGSHDLRDYAISYIIEEIGEHKLAHFRAAGWFTSVAKLKRHYPEIACALGSSELTFNKLLRKQHQIFSQRILLEEEDLIRKEIEDLSHLSLLLKEKKEQFSKRSPLNKDYSKNAFRKHDFEQIIAIHLENVETFKNILERVLFNFNNWVFVNKKEHKRFKKEKGFSRAYLQELLHKEAAAGKTDINKIHLLFNYFEKEKINILRDLDLLESLTGLY
jgi:hypothetical protein